MENLNSITNSAVLFRNLTIGCAGRSARFTPRRILKEDWSVAMFSLPIYREGFERVRDRVTKNRFHRYISTRTRFGLWFGEAWKSYDRCLIWQIARDCGWSRKYEFEHKFECERANDQRSQHMCIIVCVTIKTHHTCMSWRIRLISRLFFVCI